jgi:molecular chaperone GrpE (heat shock protein)
LGGAGSHRDQAGPTLAEQLEEFGVSDELRALVAELEVGAAETAAAAAAAAELVAALKDAQLRLTADFENFRKRTVREPSRNESQKPSEGRSRLIRWPFLAAGCGTVASTRERERER